MELEGVREGGKKKNIEGKRWRERVRKRGERRGAGGQ